MTCKHIAHYWCDDDTSERYGETARTVAGKQQGQGKQGPVKKADRMFAPCGSGPESFMHACVGDTVTMSNSIRRHA